MTLAPESITKNNNNLNEIQIRHVPLATEADRRSIETCFVNSKLLLIFLKITELREM